MWAFLKALPGLFGGAFQIVQVVWQLVQLIREWYEREQRRAVVAEVRDALKEARETMDNSRLNNIFNPMSEPFPAKKRGKNESPTS